MKFERRIYRLCLIIGGAMILLFTFWFPDVISLFSDLETIPKSKEIIAFHPQSETSEKVPSNTKTLDISNAIVSRIAIPSGYAKKEIKEDLSHEKVVSEDSSVCSVFTRPAGAPKFQTSMCFSSETCIGNLTVVGLSCEEFSDQVAQDQPSRTIIHSAGPDSFRIRLEGPEILMLNPKHTGNCTYFTSFSLLFTGNYAIQAFTMFHHFHGAADYPYAQPQPQYTPSYIVDRDFHISCVRPKVAPTHNHSVCESLMEAGRWIKRPNNRKIQMLPVPPVDWPFNYEKVYGIQFTKHWGNHYMWSPYSCHYVDYKQDSLVDCLKGKNLHFFGDSQTRTLFYACLNLLHINRILGNPKIVDQNPNNEGWIEFIVRGNITFRYSLDNLLDAVSNEHSMQYANFIKSDSSKWDILITGMGNWAMCGNLQRLGVGLWPLRKYKQEIERIAGEIREFKLRNSRTRVVLAYHSRVSVVT